MIVATDSISTLIISDNDQYVELFSTGMSLTGYLVPNGINHFKSSFSIEIVL